MKKVPTWLTWDWKSINGIAKILVFGVFILLMFIKLPDWIRNWKGENLILTTTGQFISAKPMERLSQGKMGNKRITEGYTIDYSYSVNQQVYYGVDNIPNSVENLKFLNLLAADPNQKLNIKYNPNNPEKSQIMISKD